MTAAIGIKVHQAYYRSKQLDHLGLIAEMYIVPDQTKRIVPIGQAVKAMVLNGLGLVNRSLYLSEPFFSNKPVGRLIGKGIEAKHLNDEVLGRVLDTIYASGPEQLYWQFAS
ncbi:MAG: DUF4277 domain-containing protein [Thioploca sp.]|nr:DUF4277 domain-containing protein [Thioploca sp.]